MIRFGVLGTGDISDVFMNSFPKETAEVTGVYHRDASKAKAFAAKYGIKNIFDSVESLASSGVDCIYNALPNSLHFEPSVLCLNRGVNVLIEKPMASNSRQLERLINVAAENNVYAMEVNRVEFLDSYNYIRERINRVGAQLLVNVNYCKRSRRYDDYLNNANPNVFSTEFSGGALYDLGVYGLQFVCGLFGEPQNLKYNALLLNSGVDGMGSLLLGYEKYTSTINVSKVSDGGSSVLIHGEGGRIESRYAPSVMREVCFTPQNGDKEQFVSSESGFSAFLRHAAPIIETRDTQAYEKLTQLSRLVTRLMQYARAQNGISFSSDKPFSDKDRFSE